MTTKHKNEAEMKADLQLLVECLKYHINNPPCLKQALLAISSACSDNDSAQEHLRESGGLKFIMNLFTSNDATELKESALYCLSCAIDHNEFSKKALSTLKIFEHLHRIFGKMEPTVKLYQTAAYLISCIVTNNGTGQTIVRKSGCLEDLITLFRSFLPIQNISSLQQEEWVKELSVETTDLWLSINNALCVCVNNPQNENNQELCSSLLPLAISALQCCEQYSVVRSILSLLGLTVANCASNQEKLLDTGGIKVLADLLKRFTEITKTDPDALKIAVSVTIALDSCLTDNVMNAQVFSEYCGIPSIVSLLTMPALEAQSRLQVVVTLAHALDYCASSQQQLVDCGGLPVLVNLLSETTDEEMSNAIKYVLQVCVSVMTGNSLTAGSKSNILQQGEQHERTVDRDKSLMQKMEELLTKLTSDKNVKEFEKFMNQRMLSYACEDMVKNLNDCYNSDHLPNKEKTAVSRCHCMNMEFKNQQQDYQSDVEGLATKLHTASNSCTLPTKYVEQISVSVQTNLTGQVFSAQSKQLHKVHNEGESDSYLNREKRLGTTNLKVVSDKVFDSVQTVDMDASLFGNCEETEKETLDFLKPETNVKIQSGTKFLVPCSKTKFMQRGKYDICNTVLQANKKLLPEQGDSSTNNSLAFSDAEVSNIYSEFDSNLIKDVGAKRQIENTKPMLNATICKKSKSADSFPVHGKTFCSKLHQIDNNSIATLIIPSSDSDASALGIALDMEHSPSPADCESNNDESRCSLGRHCPGCKPPCQTDGQLLNSRTYNLAIETGSYTCIRHRYLRQLERDFTLKQNLAIRSKRYLHLKPNWGTITVNEKNNHRESVYNFQSTSSNSEYSQAVSPPYESQSVSEECNVKIYRKKAHRDRIPYSEEELENLVKGVKTLGKHWNQIYYTYKFHPSRTAVDLKEKYKRISQSNCSSMKFSSHRKCLPFSMCEERRLRRGVKRFGSKWKSILKNYKFSKERSAVDLRSRWRCLTRSKIKKTKD